ncbi:hypothetical protein BpHYR1_024378 [Brachionus plicatilis]|uniref:Uncharacterized protein n=1 Tax=Brachionus plicatilis TaxID=10195 RepID=A0A3M7R1M1_BRAPC|nr:hypothetical protein BpHYR1_024378 [Brachionus plicatilis]
MCRTVLMFAQRRKNEAYLPWTGWKLGLKIRLRLGLDKFGKLFSQIAKVVLVVVETWLHGKIFGQQMVCAVARIGRAHRTSAQILQAAARDQH